METYNEDVEAHLHEAITAANQGITAIQDLERLGKDLTTGARTSRVDVATAHARWRTTIRAIRDRLNRSLRRRRRHTSDLNPRKEGGHNDRQRSSSEAARAEGPEAGSQ